MKVDSRKIAIFLSGFLMMLFCLLTACSSFKDLSLFKSKSSHKEKHIEKSSGQSLLFDYSEAMQRDSSSFHAWILVDGDFSLHRDSGIKGEKALIQYFGMSNSLLQFKDSLISLKDSSSLLEHVENQTNLLKNKERKINGYSWIFFALGIMLVVWFYYGKYRKK